MLNSIFINNSNLFYYNYFLLKNYKFIFYFLFDLGKFKIITPFYNKNLNKNNDYYITNNIVNKFIKPKFYLKLNNCFNVFYKNIKIVDDYKSKLIFNKQNFFLNKNFINFFYSLTINKNNFIVLDSEYSHIYPLYKFIYGANTLQLYKNYFFLKPIYFTRKNWLYLFLKFCQDNKVSLIFISDYDYYVNFYKNILEFDCSISAIVPYTYAHTFIDYPLYTPYINNLIKLLYTSSLIQIYFQSYNYFNFHKKYLYMHFFIKYVNCINPN